MEAGSVTAMIPKTAPSKASTNPLQDAFWSNAWILGVVLAFSAVVALLQLTVPMFILLIYDRVIPARSVETLITLLVAACLLLGSSAFLDYARRRLLARLGARLQARVEGAALALDADLSSAVGGTQIRYLDDIRVFVHSPTALAIIDILWMPLFLGTMFVLHPWLGWTALIGLGLLAAIFALGEVLSSWRIGKAKAASDAVGALTRQIKQTGTSNRTGAGGVDWCAARGQARDAAVQAHDRTVAVRTVLQAVRTIFTLLVLAVGGVLILTADVTAGALVASIVLLNRVFAPVLGVLGEVRAIRTARQSWCALDAAFVAQRGAPRPDLAPAAAA